MGLQAGDRLGPYEVQALLGVGGMGEVYRGRDTRLGRDVALKVISPKRVEDASLRRRFELEARAASVLNHPSIVTVYDVGETGGVSWIAMEWVEGRTLRQVLGPGPLAVRDALSLARQIAEGLAAAHAKGVVHRDLKPENVMVTAEGRAKILDFGLARLAAEDAPQEAMSGLETMEVPPDATRAGTILGTVGYMSPEQAAGRPVDFRSDQFSFGLILYEMLAGRRAFARPTAPETLAAIIREDPAPLASLRTGIPKALARRDRGVPGQAPRGPLQLDPRAFVRARIGRGDSAVDAGARDGRRGAPHAARAREASASPSCPDPRRRSRARARRVRRVEAAGRFPADRVSRSAAVRERRGAGRRVAERRADGEPDRPHVERPLIASDGPLERLPARADDRPSRGRPPPGRRGGARRQLRAARQPRRDRRGAGQTSRRAPGCGASATTGRSRS